MLSALRGVLSEIGKQVEVCPMPDGSTVLLLPHGGRVLGLFAPESEENFYWTNEALQSAGTARAYYDSAEWQNSGGDRTWLAPEIDIFFPHFPDLDMGTYWQPRELDPGRYAVVRENGTPQMVNRLSLILSRSREQVSLVMRKWVSPAPNPLRYEPELSGLRLEYAGYTRHTSLTISGGGPSGPIGLWHLLQMPHGGELIVPTYSRATPAVYMGCIPDQDLCVADRLVRYRMHSPGEHKIALRAVAVSGRAGYLYPTNGRVALVVCNFSINPSGEYIDVPWREEYNLGFAVQACNVDSKWGKFSELEYHVPAIGGRTGSSSCEDVSQVWAFRGEESEIRQVAEILLSAGCLR